MAGAIQQNQKNKALITTEMQADIQQAKAALRKQIRSVLQTIPPATRVAASALIRERLKKQIFWQNAKSVLFFAPLPYEVDVWPLMLESLSEGKSAALPRFDSASNDYLACRVQNPQHEIKPGAFGIREPGAHCPEIPLERLDLILVPGIGFDRKGCRLGRGRGFYDRLLAQTHRVKCGIAFDEQVVDEIPVGPQDVRMNFILTPTRCAEISG